MPIIQTPDGPVNFPDSMKDADIESVLQKQYAPKVAGAGFYKLFMECSNLLVHKKLCNLVQFKVRYSQKK